MEYNPTVVYLGYIFLAINTIFFFKNYRFGSIALKIFVFYLLFCFIIQCSSELLIYLYSDNPDNLYLSHYYFIGQFIFLSFFFKSILKNSLIKMSILVVLIFVIPSLTLFYFIFPENYTKFNIFEIIITSVPLVIWSLFFFIQKIGETNKKYIYINCGFFLYLVCSSLLFMSGNIKADLKEFIWYSNDVLYLTYQILIFVEWYKNFRKPEVAQ